MSDLRELYQEMILDHNKRPRNFREMERPDCQSEGHNPLCGDQLTLYLQIEDGVVKDASFKGAGCAISTASASMMTDAIKGQPVEEVSKLFESFRSMVTDGLLNSPEDMGKLAVFAGVGEYPVRVKCATLAWHTLSAALEGQKKSVSTE